MVSGIGGFTSGAVLEPVIIKVELMHNGRQLGRGVGVRADQFPRVHRTELDPRHGGVEKNNFEVRAASPNRRRRLAMRNHVPKAIRPQVDHARFAKVSAVHPPALRVIRLLREVFGPRDGTEVPHLKKRAPLRLRTDARVLPRVGRRL